MAINEKVLSIVIQAKNMTAGGVKGASDSMGGISKGAAVGGAALTAFGVAGAAALNKTANSAVSFGKEAIQMQRITGANAKTSSTFAAILGRVGIEGSSAARMVGNLSKLIKNDTETVKVNSSALKAKIAGLAAHKTALMGQMSSMKLHGTLTKDAEIKIKEQIIAINNQVATLHTSSAAQSGLTKTVMSSKNVLLQYGIATRDQNGHYRNQLDVMMDVAEKYKTMKNRTEASALASKIFGKQFKDMLPLLAGGKEGFTKLIAKVQEMGLALTQDNLDAVKRYGSAVKDNEMAQKGLEVQMGLSILPIKTMIAEGLMKAFAWFNKLSPAMKGVIKTITLLVVGFALIGGPITTLIGLIGGGVAAFGFLGPAATIAWAAVSGPILPIIAAIALVAFGVYEIIKHWSGIKKFFSGLWKSVKAGVIAGYHAVVDWLKKNALNLATALIPGLLLVRLLFAVNWKKVGESVKDGLSAAGRWIVQWVGKIGGWFISLPGKLQDIGMGLGKSIATGIWNGLKAMGTWLYNTVWGWIKSVIPGPIKKALGIASPSALMHLYGRMAAAGMGGGVIAGTDGVKKAALGLATAVTTGARVALQAPGYSVGAASFADAGPIRSTMPIGGSGAGKQEIHLYLDGKEMTRAIVKQTTQSRRSGVR